MVMDTVFESRHGVALTSVSLSLPEALNESQWNEIGDQVVRLDNSTNWMIGDWWVYGEHRYGTRKKWLAEQKAYRAQFKSFRFFVNCASVCRTFESTRRRALVSFEMHKALAGLKESDQEEFLDRIESGEIKTRKELRAILRQKVKSAKTAPLIVLEDGKTVQINNPLPSWHVMKHTTPGKEQEVGCTVCWSLFKSHRELVFGKITKASQGIDVLHYNCECPDSSRSSTILGE